LTTRFGIDRVPVRGLPTVRWVVPLAGLAFDLIRNVDRILR
jgi:hypothetical protein